VLLYPEGMVKLNRSAGEILARCDGRRALPTIVADLEQAFSTSGLRNDVEAFLAIAAKQRWVVGIPEQDA
jgi:pyrroloquinoline quinone biosynthesis protein D